MQPERIATWSDVEDRSPVGAKTGTGGHLPGQKVTGKIAEVREIDEGEDAISPATFPDLISIDDYRAVAAEVRETSGGIPIGAELSAQHIEADIDAALEIGVDYVILDGRGRAPAPFAGLFLVGVRLPSRQRRQTRSGGVPLTAGCDESCR